MSYIIIIWNLIKKNWKLLLGFVCGILLILNIMQCSHSNSLKNDLKHNHNNLEAVMAERDSIANRCVLYQYSIREMELYSDSINNKLLETRKKLGLKDKKIQQMQYMLSNFKSDTVTLLRSDTVFKDPNFILDTTLGDTLWMPIHLKMYYPGTIQVSSSCRSEKTVFLSTKRVTIDAPKKFFLCRWLQKKQTVIEAVINESNPHIKSEKNRFIQVQEN